MSELTFDLQLLKHLPQPLDIAVFWLITDAAGYWIHRWYHSNPILWQFHSVHHAQTELTFVTSFRNHVVEQMCTNVVLFVPMKILGFPVWYWAPVRPFRACQAGPLDLSKIAAYRADPPLL